MIERILELKDKLKAQVLAFEIPKNIEDAIVNDIYISGSCIISISDHLNYFSKTIKKSYNEPIYSPGGLFRGPRVIGTESRIREYSTFDDEKATLFKLKLQSLGFLVAISGDKFIITLDESKYFYRS